MLWMVVVKTHSDLESPLVLTCLARDVGQIICISDYKTRFELFTFLCKNNIQLSVRIGRHKFIYVLKSVFFVKPVIAKQGSKLRAIGRHGRLTIVWGD